MVTESGGQGNQPSNIDVLPGNLIHRHDDNLSKQRPRWIMMALDQVADAKEYDDDRRQSGHE